jgi:hypothetical protein
MDLLKDKARRFTDRSVMPLVLDDVPFSELSVEWPSEAQTSVRDMQGLICYLLRKNQQLRMELSAANAPGGHK